MSMHAQCQRKLSGFSLVFSQRTGDLSEIRPNRRGISPRRNRACRRLPDPSGFTPSPIKVGRKPPTTGDFPLSAAELTRMKTLKDGKRVGQGGWARFLLCYSDI